MQFTRETIEAEDSLLIQIAMEAAKVENPYRLYYGESDMPTPALRRIPTRWVNTPTPTRITISSAPGSAR